MFTVETTTEATDLDTDEEEEMGQRKEELVAFYSEHDPTKIATVDELLRDYDFAVLVRTIKQKYGVAPPEWEELAEEEEGADGACTTVLSCVRPLASHSLVFVPWFGVSSCIAEGLRKAEAWVSMEMSQQFVKVDPQGIAITPQVPVPVA
jgi:hypothetical protein